VVCMTNHESKDGVDQVLTGTMRWDLGFGNEYAHEVVWRCDGMRAGRLYSRSTFGSREEAEKFAQKMRRAEPDQILEAIAASTTWN